jgi:hypothetical protein
MSAFSCPKCNGKCCRDVVYGHHRTHWAANEYAHDCAFCHDGTVPVRTPEDERADVLAYIGHAREFPFTHASGIPAVLDALSDLIAQGKHEGWAKKATERGA